MEELYNQYRALLFTLAYQLTGSAADAEDAVQDVFIKVWKNIDKYDSSKGTLFTWMLQITRNTCIDHLRTKEHKIKFQSEINLQETLATPEIHLNNENSELRRLALKLETKYRQIIDLVYFWGYSQEEVAKMLNIPLGTVKTRSRAGLQELRSLYQNMNKSYQR